MEAVKGLAITADQKGVVFDVPLDDLNTYLTGQENAANVSLEVVKALPQDCSGPASSKYRSPIPQRSSHSATTATLAEEATTPTTLICGERVDGINNETATLKLRGCVGTTVKIKVQ